jgi:hypothetical protein
MRSLFLSTAVCVLLWGCEAKNEAAETANVEGRYQGIGVYNAGSGWARMTVPPAEPGSRAARLADDDHVIVVTDSRTGEVRQCGDLSGYCIRLNPWTQTLDASRAAPVALEPLRDEKGRLVER